MDKKLEQHGESEPKAAHASEERVEDLEVPEQDTKKVQGGLNFTKIAYNTRSSISD